MNEINSGTLLHRAPELDLTLESTGEITVYIRGTSLRFGHRAIRILDAFSYSRTFVQVVDEQVSREGAAALDDIVATIMELAAAQVLRIGPREAGISAKPYPFGLYDSPGVQIKILQDRARRQAYLRAIREAVRPGDVVLDIGTGSGILAVAAAQAGARHVYAIEPSNTAACAREVFAANGVAEQITLIEGWSQDIELPERVDLLTYDLVGSEPLEMQVLEVTADAVARHLKYDARIIPGAFGYSMVAVEVPSSTLDQYSYSQSQFGSWRDWYGVDFSALARSVGGGVVPAYVRPDEARRLKRLSAPAALWRVDLRQAANNPAPSAEIDIVATEAGLCSGVFGITEIELCPSVTFYTDPQLAGDAPHWMTAIWLLSPSIPVGAGDRLRFGYQHLGRGRSEVSVSRSPGQPEVF